MEQIRLQALAEMEKRKRAGTWTAGVRPHIDYQTRPVAWITEKLGIPENTLRWSMNPGYDTHTWDGDRDPIIKMLEAIGAGKDCGVESATGGQKTFSAACLTYWFLACFPDARVIHVAPKEDQLLTQVWMEIGKLWPRFLPMFPQAELLTGKLRMKPAVEDREVWAATAFVCGVGANEELAGKAKGFHAQHMLIITEETQSIDAAIMGSLEQTRTDDHNIQLSLGNPDHRRDQLHLFCTKPSVVDVRISAFDHPNVVSGTSIVPGAIGRRRLEERKAQFHSPEDRGYLSQLRGISPAESHEALIRWDWCERAAEHWKDPAYRVGSPWLGVDAANSESGDRGAKARGVGACCTEVESFPCPDADKLGIEVVDEIKATPLDPRYVGVDGVGVGASTVNAIKRLGIRVRVIMSGNKGIPGLDADARWSEVNVVGEEIKAAGPRIVQTETFGCLRDQVLWILREDLRKGQFAMPYDKELFEDLCALTYSTATGKIVVCDKDTVRKLLKRSTNKGDSVAYGNFVRRRAWLPKSDGKKAEAKSTQNRDTGLEKYLDRAAKRAKAEEQRIRRMYRPLRKRA